MKKGFLILLFLSGCSSLEINDSFEYVDCYYTPSDVNDAILEGNLSIYEGKKFNLQEINRILLNPSDKKTIDNVDYYFFGFKNVCLTTVPVKNGVVQDISVQGFENGCLSTAQRSDDLIGIYKQEYSGFTPFREEYCGFHSLYKKTYE